MLCCFVCACFVLPDSFSMSVCDCWFWGFRSLNAVFLCFFDFCLFYKQAMSFGCCVVVLCVCAFLVWRCSWCCCVAAVVARLINEYAIVLSCLLCCVSCSVYFWLYSVFVCVCFLG